MLSFAALIRYLLCVKSDLFLLVCFFFRLDLYCEVRSCGAIKLITSYSFSTLPIVSNEDLNSLQLCALPKKYSRFSGRELLENVSAAAGLR